MPVEVTPAPIVRQGHGLISAAVIDPAGNTGDDHWWKGITFGAPGCGPGSVYPECSTTPRAPLGEAQAIKATPWIVEGPGLQCSSANVGDLGERARLGLEAVLQARIEGEFWTDSLADNPNALVHMPATGILGGGAAYSPVNGLAALVAAAQSRQLTIHAPTALATAWASADLLSGGARLETLVGRHIVVAGDGYPGTPPDSYGGPPLGPNEVWVYATGAVKLLLSSVRTNGIPDPVGPDGQRPDNGGLNVTANMHEARAERTVGLIHDECVWVGLKIDLCKGCCS